MQLSETEKHSALQKLENAENECRQFSEKLVTMQVMLQFYCKPLTILTKIKKSQKTTKNHKRAQKFIRNYKNYLIMD